LAAVSALSRCKDAISAGVSIRTSDRGEVARFGFCEPVETVAEFIVPPPLEILSAFGA
jgi:hypothetical protein